MAISSAIIVKNELNDYVSNLHSYLGPYCFTNGAFVIEDDGSLLALLKKYNPTQINGSFKSHTSFLTDPSQPIFECHVDVVLICNGCEPGSQDRAHVKNIKWYPFKNYIYFKLEGHPTFNEFGTINASHALQFVKRHILGKNKGTCKKRREDCQLDKKCLTNAKELNHKMYQIGQNAPVAIIESHARAGDEMFIPLAVSKTFLLNIDKKMKFDFVNGTVFISPDTVFVEAIVNESEVPVGGKMSRKSMPFTVRKLPNRRLYSVKSKDRTFAKGTTLEKAKAQVRLLYLIERQKATMTRQ